MTRVHFFSSQDTKQTATVVSWCGRMLLSGSTANLPHLLGPGGKRAVFECL